MLSKDDIVKINNFYYIHCDFLYADDKNHMVRDRALFETKAYCIRAKSSSETKQMTVYRVDKKTNEVTVILTVLGKATNNGKPIITLYCDFNNSEKITIPFFNTTLFTLMIGVYVIWPKLQRARVNMRFSKNVIIFYRLNKKNNTEHHIKKIVVENCDAYTSLSCVSALGHVRNDDDFSGNITHILTNLLTRIKSFTKYYIADPYSNDIPKKHKNTLNIIRLLHNNHHNHALSFIENRQLTVKKVEIGLDETTDHLSTDELIAAYRSQILADSITQLIAPHYHAIGKYVLKNLKSLGAHDLICCSVDHILLDYNNPDYDDIINRLDDQGITVITDYSGAIYTHVPTNMQKIFLQILTNALPNCTNIAEILSNNQCISCLLTDDMLSDEMKQYIDTNIHHK